MARVALVTGGSRGIGLSFAQALLGAGFQVAITAARDRVALDAAEAALVESHGMSNVQGLLADSGDPQAAEAAVEATVKRFGRLDVLVNNAGRGPREFNADFHNTALKFWQIDPGGWAELMRSNVNGPFLMARAAAPHMLRAGWGRIVNISTSRATMIKTGNAPYGPSKAALDAMTRMFAEDLDGTGVTVNALAPGGPTETDFFPRTGRRGVYLDMLPVDVMNAALLWLCSEAAAQVTAARFIGKLWDPADPGAAREDTGAPPMIL
jgi:NAD(P)-dependent dehydrogenase (short-subunit alcohol dehydrogenase family)